MTVDARALTTRFLVACALARTAGEIAKRRFLQSRFLHRRLQGPAGLPHRGRRRGRARHRDAPARSLSRRRLHRRGGRGPRRRARRADLGRRSDRRHLEFRARRAAFLRLDRGRPRRRGRDRRHLRSDGRRIVRGAARRGRDAERRGDARLRDARSQSRLGRGRLEHAHGRGRVSRPARPGRRGGARPVVRSGSGALGLAYVAAGRRDGYVENHMNAWDCLAGIVLVREAGGYVSDFLAGEGLREGNPILACAPRRQGRAAQDRRDQGSRRVSGDFLDLASGRRARSIALARRRGAELERRRARSAVAGRSRDLEPDQPDPLSRRRLDARRRARGGPPICRWACTDSLPQQDFRRRGGARRFRAPDPARQRARRARSIPSRFSSRSNIA